MAETVKYYLSGNIVVYPGQNSENDEGKLNTENNLSHIITRITERNYCLSKNDFSISAEPDTDYGYVIQIAKGQCNIQGYHIITNNYIRVRPPQTITGTKIAIGMKLARDGSNNLLGDVTYNTISEYKGVWISYFDYDVAYNDPETFILGYFDWDGAVFTNVQDNPEKLGRIDAKHVLAYLSDPKHPNVDFMYLQDWIDIVPDWYISKEGDVTYGEIDFLPGRIEGDDPDQREDPSAGNKDPGIHIQAETDNYSLIHMMSSEKQNNGHELWFINDEESRLKNSTILFTYLGEDRGKLFVSDPDNWLELYSNSVLHLDSETQTLINSNGPITSYVNGLNNLIAELTAKHFTLSNPGLNNMNIDFTINNDNLKFLLGDALFNYNNTTDMLTISGLERLIIDDPTLFRSNVTINDYLKLGPDSSATILRQNKWVLNTDNLTQTFDDQGHLLKQKAGSREPRSRWENTSGSEYTEITPGMIEVKGPNAGIIFKNSSGTGRKIYIDDSGKLVIEGDVYIKQGNILLDDGYKTWKAVYN